MALTLWPHNIQAEYYNEDAAGRKQRGEVCYECHEELLHNPVLLPEDIARFAQLIRHYHRTNSWRTNGILRPPEGGTTEALLDFDAALAYASEDAINTTLRGIIEMLFSVRKDHPYPCPPLRS